MSEEFETLGKLFAIRETMHSYVCRSVVFKFMSKETKRLIGKHSRKLMKARKKYSRLEEFLTLQNMFMQQREFKT